MSEQKIAPVLSDDDIRLIIDAAYNQPLSLYAAIRRTEQAVLARVGAVREQAQIPEGYALVPIEPTKEMLAAGRQGVSYTQAPWLAERYAAMLQAAPAIRALKGTPPAAVADSMPGWLHWEARIKALMQDMGMPNSHSAYRALSQLANEMGQAHAASVALQPSSNPEPLAAVKAKRLPKLPEELYEHYVSMSAQTHEAQVQAYARAAIAASKEGASHG